VTERPKVRHWKCRSWRKLRRGFESHPLRFDCNMEGEFFRLLRDRKPAFRLANSHLAKTLAIIRALRPWPGRGAPSPGAARCSSFGFVGATRIRFIPRAASADAKTSPIPEDVPVMTAVEFSKSA
jgi:hypothetical protein